MIVGSLHLYKTQRVGMLAPKAERTDDLSHFDFTGASELEVIEMLESVLGTLKARYEAQRDKPTDPEAGMTPRERARARREAVPKQDLIPPGYDPDDEVDDDDDATPTGKLTADQAATMQQDARG